MFGRILGVVGKALIISGLLVLGFVAYQLWGTGLESSRGQADLAAELAATVDTGGSTDAATVRLSDLRNQLAEVDPATAPATAPPPEGQPIGIITIPRIGLEQVVVQGVEKADLKKGPGHYPGTPLPGQAGNSAIAGHRTTYGAPFNRIDELVPGDEVRVATAQGEFTYAVIPAPGQPADGQAWYAVSPKDVSVLEDRGDARLTLTACHPKYSAQQRIIVHAVLRGPVAAASEVAVATPAARPAAASGEGAGEGDRDALPRALLFGAAAALLALLAWTLSRFTSRWLVWAIATPGILVLIWFGYVHLDRYLPAL